MEAHICYEKRHTMNKIQIEQINCEILLGRIKILLDPPHCASIEFDAKDGWPSMGSS